MDALTPIEVTKLRSASTQAHQLGEDLIAAHFEEKNRAFFIDSAADKLIDIGHVLGLTFSREHRIRGELAIQRTERAIVHGTRRVVENIAARASSADTWQRRAETAEAALQKAMVDTERLSQQLADIEAEVIALRVRKREAA